jgi:tetratricopeptide (TPR) repeat protein
MSRFGNLEFEGESENLLNSDTEQVKSEAYYLALARTAFANGDFEPALRMYSKVLEFNPQNTIAWSSQVRMLIELEEYREARLWAEKALERFPQDPELLAAKAVALARLGDTDGAMAFSDASIEERGDTPYVWLARGDVLLARKEQRADYCFERAFLAAPQDWFVLWLAARIRSFYRQFSQALKLLKQAVELNAGHFLLWLELGSCQASLGLVGPAEFSYKQAQELNPQCRARLALLDLQSVGLGARICGLWRRLFR